MVREMHCGIFCYLVDDWFLYWLLKVRVTGAEVPIPYVWLHGAIISDFDMIFFNSKSCFFFNFFTTEKYFIIGIFYSSTCFEVGFFLFYLLMQCIFIFSSGYYGVKGVCTITCAFAIRLESFLFSI